MIKEFIENLRNKSVHIVGVTGAEGSAILRFLKKHNVSNITAHDFLSGNTVEKSFKLWHKGMTVKERDNLFQIFLNDLETATLYKDSDYLKNIEKADIIFIPQSWRLYKENKLLNTLKEKGVPFYSLTRMYLDLSPAKIIAVTGTVGKGSTAGIISQILRLKGLHVYTAGNDTWMNQIADRLDEMTKDDILVLEVSHRQLQDGFTRAPHIAVLTNLYPNHLDEVSWKDYQDLKISLFRNQSSNDFAVVNYDIPDISDILKGIKSNILYYSTKEPEKNSKSIQKIYQSKLDNISAHFTENILAASTVVSLFDIDADFILNNLSKITTLPARLQKIGEISGINFYDDIKSTTPWATIAALDKLGKNTILICGGRTKGIDYDQFAKKVNNNIFIYMLKSELSAKLAQLFIPDRFKIADNLQDAMNSAYVRAQSGDNILISPAAGFFYTDFIKGKKSLRSLTSLLPKEQV